MHKRFYHTIPLRKLTVVIFVCLLLQATGFAQTDSLPPVVDSVKEVDIKDVAKKLFGKKVKPNPKPEDPGEAAVALLPSVGYNPSFGFTMGVNLTMGKQFGKKENTIYSVLAGSALYGTKGITTFKLRHNIFTPQNKWNLQGDWQFSIMGVVDYGIGTGQGRYLSNGTVINDLPTKLGDSAFPIKYNYFQLFEKVYRKVGKNFYIGGGIGFNITKKIRDERRQQGKHTPHELYSKRNGFDSSKYFVNGFLVAFQYNTREHPTRSYKGIYADVQFRYNPEWLGSSRYSWQMMFDFREYIPLSDRIPTHVLAFWQWASFQLGGALPYLEMPGTAKDMYNRSGRAYTLGRFKGPSYACMEAEYRFPISANRLLSGVAFVNLQSASDDRRVKIFDFWEPGYGAGLRILFDKKSRTVLCVDYARGRYGSSGIFFGLNEVF